MTAPAADGPRAGFTLLEMLVTLAILVAISAVSIAALGPTRAQRAADGTRDAVIAELNRARVAAIATGAPQSVAFDLASRTIRRSGAAPVAIAPSVRIGLVTAREARSGSRDAGTILFLPDGRSSGGRIEISAGLLRRAVEINWLTGLIEEAAP